jgi:LmbE family N-acetylglucosaminyl deacetylase
VGGLATETREVTGIHRLAFEPSGPLGVLAIGAHADDIEIGSGGTILRLLAEHPGSSIRWVVASASPVRAAEARSSAAAFSALATDVEIIVGDLPDGGFPSASTGVKDLLESVKDRPVDLILAPNVDDAHQDHRVVAEVVWQTFRHHLIASYEIPKYDGDLGRPNLFVDLDEATVDRKVDLLHANYPSQHHRTWWGASTVQAIARLRGIEAATMYAEGFYCRKLVL